MFTNCGEDDKNNEDDQNSSLVISTAWWQGRMLWPHIIMLHHQDQEVPAADFMMTNVQNGTFGQGVARSSMCTM